MRFVVLASPERLPCAEMAVASIRHYHPTAHIVHMGPPGKSPEQANETWISQKLDPSDLSQMLHERVAILARSGDEPTAVLDSDTLTCRRLEGVWQTPFDVALAARLTEPERKHQQAYNSGVMFCRNALFWRSLLERMDSDPRFRTWGGDQEALALEARSGLWRFLELDGRFWHNYNVGHGVFPAEARIVHYKGTRREWMAEHFKRGLWKGHAR